LAAIRATLAERELDLVDLRSQFAAFEGRTYPSGQSAEGKTQINVNSGAEILKFVAAAKTDLGRLTDCSGRVMYSSVETLRPGPLYTLGINPGLDPSGLDCASVGASLDELPTSHKNSYRECWDRGALAGSDPLQRNFRWLVEQLGFDLDAVCSSNIVFPRSRTASEAKKFVGACWPVHERILSIVQPKYILAFGKLPIRTLQKRFQNVQLLDSFPANHQRWTCQVFRGVFLGRGITVLGVPHLGRRYSYGPPLPMDVQRLARFIG
jgi:hypothetical protein